MSTAPISNVVRLTPRTDATVPDRPGTPAPVGRAVYTVKETAHMLSLSLGGTYALIRSGEIPAIKLGGRWCVPKRRFHDWLDNLPTASTEDIEREFAALDRADARRTTQRAPQCNGA